MCNNEGIIQDWVLFVFASKTPHYSLMLWHKLMCLHCISVLHALLKSSDILHVG